MLIVRQMKLVPLPRPEATAAAGQNLINLPRMTLRSLGVKRIWTACLSRLVARRNEFIALGPSVHPSVAKVDSLPPPPSQLRLSLPIETVVSPSKAAAAMAAKADKRTNGGDHRMDG